MRLKPLLAAALAGATVLAAAPAAQAGWITGQGSLPLFRSDSVCSDGMDFQYATYVDSPQARLLGFGPQDPGVATISPSPGLPTNATIAPAAAVTLHDLGAWAVLPSGALDPNPVVVPADATVPFNPIFVDPAAIGGSVTTWPAGAGQLTHSAQFTLPFDRPLPPGASVWVSWGNASPGTPSATAWTYTVRRCRFPFVG
jgi:hypothetical protein